MRKFAGMFILAIALVAIAQMVFAQPPGGPGRPGAIMMGPPGGGMAAFMSDEGRKDIGLSDKQVQDIQNTFRESFQGMQRPDFGGQPPSPADMEKLRNDMEKRMDETIGKVEKLLTPEQMTKSRTRMFQAGGGYGSLAMNPLAQRALNLTDDQKKKLREFQDEQMREMMNGPRPDFQNMTEEERQRFGEEMRTRFEENQKKMTEKVKGILTDEQKKQGDKMLSETPDYIQKAIERGPGGPGRAAMGGNSGVPQAYRPGADSWRPGQGTESTAPRREGGRFPRNN